MKAALVFLAGALMWAASQAGLTAYLPHWLSAAAPFVAAALAALGIRNAGAADPFVEFLGTTKFKTVIGVIGATLAALSSPEFANVLPEKWAKLFVTAFTILAASGLYHAQAKAQTAPAEPAGVTS